MMCVESCRKGEGVCNPGRDFRRGIPSFEVEQAALEILLHPKLRRVLSRFPPARRAFCLPRKRLVRRRRTRLTLERRLTAARPPGGHFLSAAAATAAIALRCLARLFCNP